VRRIEKPPRNFFETVSFFSLCKGVNPQKGNETMKNRTLRYSVVCCAISSLLLLIGSTVYLSAAGTASITGQITAAGTNPPYAVPGIVLTLVGNGPQQT
jgi:hypothetical protein